MPLFSYEMVHKCPSEGPDRHTDSGDLSPTRTSVPYVLLAIVREQLLHHQFFIRMKNTCEPKNNCNSVTHSNTCEPINENFQSTTKTKNHQGPLNFSKNIVSLVHHGAYRALMVHMYPIYHCSGA